MTGYRSLSSVLLALAIAIPCPLAAQAKATAATRLTPEQRVDSLMAAYDRTDSPGGVVAVVRGGEVIFAKGYGMAQLEYGIPNTPQTIYHVASISKQFTAFAIALLESRGLLSLDDEIHKYLPELPDFGAPITIRQLIHHTSGLRDQWALWVVAGGTLADVIRQEELLQLVQRQRELNFAPGTANLYCNTGYTLLSEIVERVSGESFREFMRKNVFEPLGMKDSQIYEDHGRIVPGRAYSYIGSPDRGVRKMILSYGNQGATSLFTTVLDLARWVNNFRTGQVGGPGVIARMQERGVLASGDTIIYAFGLVIDEFRGLRRIAHSGSDAGFRTMVAYYPELDAGVITFSNVASFPGSMAERIAEVFFGEHMTPRPPAPAHQHHPVPQELLERYTGIYRVAGGPAYTFRVEDGRLTASVEGDGDISYRAVSDSVFAVVAQLGRTVFHREPDGRVLRATITTRNGTFEARRIEPWSPDAAELATFAGTYYSPELETVYTVSVEDGKLVARHRRHGRIRLEPLDRDAFRGEYWFLGAVRFERHAAGTVTGMRVTCNRAHNLYFERMK